MTGNKTALQMTPYLSFDGQCEAAFQLYEQCLGARPGAISSMPARP
jgi:uncharacterized glyoxalase superfamily protein PhnB